MRISKELDEESFQGLNMFGKLNVKKTFPSYRS
jgi:hypothetical protein